MTETTERDMPAYSPSWAAQQDRRAASHALPESTISRIATLLAHGFARPDDSADLIRAAEAMRAMRVRAAGLEAAVGRLEGRVGELEAEVAGLAGLVDGREAERLVGEYRAAGI